MFVHVYCHLVQHHPFAETSWCIGAKESCFFVFGECKHCAKAVTMFRKLHCSLKKESWPRNVVVWWKEWSESVDNLFSFLFFTCLSYGDMRWTWFVVLIFLISWAVYKIMINLIWFLPISRMCVCWSPRKQALTLVPCGDGQRGMTKTA